MVRTRWSALALGALSGAGAFVAGYVLTWILAGTRVTQLTVGGPFGSAVPDWRAILWVFYDSHFVGTGTPRIIGPGGDVGGSGRLVDTVGLLGVEYLYVVPPLVLLAAGGALAWRLGASDAREGVRAGIRLVPGYFVLVVLGMMIGQQTGVGPSPLRAVVVAGVVYPVAFGAFGGVVASMFGRESPDAGGQQVVR